MAQLDLLVSPPGTGKTTFCVDRFRAEIQKSRSGLDSRSYFVLPSREHATRIQNLLLKGSAASPPQSMADPSGPEAKSRIARGGFFNAHVLTLNDLSAQFSGITAPAPTDAVRTALVRSLLEEEAASGNLSFFGRVAHARGFVRALSSFLGEMRRGLVTIEDFERFSQPLLADPVFRLKFRDLSILAKRYQAALRVRGFAEPEEYFMERGASFEGGADPSADLLIFDGFYHFTRAQMALVAAFSRGSRHVIATLTSPSDPADRLEVFAYAARTRKELEALGFRSESKRFSISYRAAKPALEHLSTSLFLPTPTLQKSAEAIQIIEAPNAREEMRAVAREIRRLYRQEVLHWSDVAVILRSVEPYRKILESAFSEFGIPVHIHERRKLIEQGLAQTTARFLRLLCEDWREMDAAFVLRSSCRVREGEAAAALELTRAARAVGVTDGRPAWAALAEESSLTGPARGVLEHLLKDEERLRSARTASEFSRWLQAWIRSMDADEDVLVRGALEELVERFGRGTPGEEVFSPVHAAQQLVDAIEAGLYSEKPRGRNRVQVYAVVMALPKEYKTVFLSGLAERVFPKETTEEPILRDVERRALNNRAGQAIFEERSMRLSGERYFFYMAATRARERLVLTYPAAGLDGRPVLSSIFVDDVKRCFAPGALTVRRSARETGPAFWEGEREAVLGILSESFSPISQASDGQIDSRVAAWMPRIEFREAFAAGLRDCSARLIDPENRRRLASSDRAFSASSLEALVACRFKYFSSKLLRLNALPEDRSAAEQGIVFHATLEAFYKSLTLSERADAQLWADASAAARRLLPFLEKIFAENPYFRRLPATSRAIVLAQMKRALARFAREEGSLRAVREFIPTHFELEFGVSKPFQLGGFPLRGVIDRIDVSLDGKSALVIDYKSSKTNFIRKLAKGLELQMPIYWMAVEQILGLRVAGVEHRHLKDGQPPEIRVREEFKEGLGKTKGIDEVDVEVMLKRTRDDAAAAVGALRNADIAVQPKTCDYCDYSPVCRFEKWKLIYRESP